jgi:hypothetical protein
MATPRNIKLCEYCGRQFEAKRGTAKYCSNSCRTKAYRRRHGIAAPDFHKISVPTSSQSEKEQNLTFLREELERYTIDAKKLENKYQNAMHKYQQAIKSYEMRPSNWSRDYVTRRRKEADEAQNMFADKREACRRLQRQIDDLQSGIDREILEKKGLVMSSDEIKALNFKSLDFDGHWKKLFGVPSHNFHMIVFGPPKSGKSTLALQFANYLKGFGSVVYVSSGERISLTIQQKIIRNDVSGIDISKAGSKQEIKFVLQKGKYNYIFIDSANQANLSVPDVEELKRKFNDTAFITVFQSTEAKDIGFNKFKHICDILVEVDQGVAKSMGRFNPYARYEIFANN